MVAGPIAYFFVRRGLPGLVRESGVRKSIGRLEDFKVGSSRVEYLGTQKVIVARTMDGEFHAVSAVCTHLGCSIRFEALEARSAFVCNCHSSKFDLDGLNLTGPAPAPLKTFNLLVSGEDLVLQED